MSKRRLLLNENQLDISGAVQSVTGSIVNNTDPENPIIEPNPRVYVFDFGGSEGNPDVTGGGSYNVRYNSGTQFTTMGIGDTAKMTVIGKIQTRNAPNLISSIGGATSVGGTFGISSLGWNWSNGNVGAFEFVVMSTRISTSTYRLIMKLNVRIFDGSVTEVKTLWSDTTSLTGITGGGVNGSFTVTYAEANSENELFLYSGVIEIYKQTQS